MTNQLRRMRDFVKRLEVPLYFVTAILALYLAGGSLLSGAKWPSEAFWQPWSVPFVGLIVTALYVPVYALYKALDAHFERVEKEEAEAANARTTLDRDLQISCQSVVSGIAEKCRGVEINDLAAHIWICRPDGSFDRRARFLLPEARKRSGIAWRKGKGVAGMAWEGDEDLRSDLRPLHRTLLSEGDAGFNALPDEAKFGLTASEVRNTMQYKGVCAIRLFSASTEDRLLGIFVIDYSGRDGDGFACVAEASEVRPVSTLIGGCEERLSEVEGLL